MLIGGLILTLALADAGAPPPLPKKGTMCGVDVTKIDPKRDLTPPKRIKGAPPVYPDSAVKAGKSGKVVIEMRITEAGKTADVKVKTSLDPDLDQAAVDAARQWEYEPLRIVGKPCDSILTMTLNFELPANETPAGAAEKHAEQPK